MPPNGPSGAATTSAPATGAPPFATTRPSIGARGSRSARCAGPRVIVTRPFRSASQSTAARPGKNPSLRASSTAPSGAEKRNSPAASVVKRSAIGTSAASAAAPDSRTSAPAIGVAVGVDHAAGDRRGGSEVDLDPAHRPPGARVELHRAVPPLRREREEPGRDHGGEEPPALRRRLEAERTVGSGAHRRRRARAREGEIRTGDPLAAGGRDDTALEDGRSCRAAGDRGRRGDADGQARRGVVLDGGRGVRASVGRGRPRDGSAGPLGLSRRPPREQRAEHGGQEDDQGGDWRAAAPIRHGAGITRGPRWFDRARPSCRGRGRGRGRGRPSTSLRG